MRRVLEATAALAKADRAAAEDVLEGPEPLQSAETLAALQYAQNIAMRQFPDADDKRIVNALADAVDDGDVVRAQVLCHLAEGIHWSIESMELMDQVGRLKKRAIALRADPDRKAALDVLALLDGDRETAGVDGKGASHRRRRGPAGRRDPAGRRRRLDDRVLRTPVGHTGRAGLPSRCADRLRLAVRMLGVVPPLTR